VALVQALAQLARLWVEGSLPVHHGPVWCGANLIPLVKRDNGVRPVAVGDTLRRLVGKVLLATPLAREQVGALHPVQVGVGVRNATESVAMGMQSLASTLAGATPWAALQVDFSNAFNSLDRSALLRAAASRAPSSYNYLRFAYGAAAPLYVGGTTIPSLTGTHQGCPLGPLGFALGIQSLVEQIQQHGGLVWSCWYLDDGILVGSPEKIQAALSYLEAQAAQLGLALNRRKCVLWGPGASLVPDKETMSFRDWDKGEGITVLGLPVDPPGSQLTL